MVDGAASARIPIISCVSRGSVLGPLLFILYTSKMFELVENRLFLYAMTPHYWQLLASQQTDLLSLPPFNRDLARILEWCNQWCMILNPNKTKASGGNLIQDCEPSPW